MIWTLSNLKTDILNYLESQKIYGNNIFFEDDGIDFKIDKDIVRENMAKKQSPNTKPKIEKNTLVADTNIKKTKTNNVEQNATPQIVNIDENSVEKNWQNSDSLEVLYNNIHDCMRCELGSTRNKFVFGTGDPNADLLIIGEAPGRDEDLQGEPFVGRSGKLLTTILESIQLSRDDVFIANILKCRPPNNRRPSTSEVDTCEEYLHKQIELINPKYILALGLTAADTLLKEKCVMKDIRGKIMDYRGKKLMITYHPSALLRNPNLKRPVWEDMKRLKELLAN